MDKKLSLWKVWAIFFLVIFISSELIYAQFVKPSQNYYCSGEVVSFTENFISVREKDEDEEFETFSIDENTKITGEISEGAEVLVIYKRKERAISGWVKLAIEIKVEKEK